MFGRLSVRLIGSLRRLSNIRSNKVTANGVNFFYEQSGHSEDALLCLPGALGSTRTDFEAQLKSPALTANYSVIAVDPCGYGQSRPPDRNFPSDYLHRDAEDGLAVMQTLGFNKFSILGWSDGANSAVIMAARAPDAVKKLVVWGGNAFITEEDMKLYEATKNVDTWSSNFRDALEGVYGPDGLRELWAKWNKGVEKIFSEGGNLYREDVGKVQCPTFLLHGLKDPLVPKFQVDYLRENLKCPLLYHEFPKGKHNIHLKYADEFNRMVIDFLSEQNV